MMLQVAVLQMLTDLKIPPEKRDAETVLILYIIENLVFRAQFSLATYSRVSNQLNSMFDRSSFSEKHGPQHW